MPVWRKQPYLLVLAFVDASAVYPQLLCGISRGRQRRRAQPDCPNYSATRSVSGEPHANECILASAVPEFQPLIALFE